MNARYVDWRDAEALYVWRCAEDVARFSFKPPPTWDEHLAYMNQLISHRHGYHWMMEDERGVPVCAFSADVDGDISIMVNPVCRREGWGREAVTFLQDRYPSLKARIKIGNLAGLLFFGKCGFKLYDVLAEPPGVIMTWSRP